MLPQTFHRREIHFFIQEQLEKALQVQFGNDGIPSGFDAEYAEQPRRRRIQPISSAEEHHIVGAAVRLRGRGRYLGAVDKVAVSVQDKSDLVAFDFMTHLPPVRASDQQTSGNARG